MPVLLKRYGLGMIRPGGKGLAPYLADGYLKQGQSLQDLALQIQVPADQLQATVARFNAMAKQGIDTDFQRGTTDYQRANGDATWPGVNPCLGELTEGPFYAIALIPGDIGACNGFGRQTEMRRVLNAQGHVISWLVCLRQRHAFHHGRRLSGTGHHHWPGHHVWFLGSRACGGQGQFQETERNIGALFRCMSYDESDYIRRQDPCFSGVKHSWHWPLALQAKRTRSAVHPTIPTNPSKSSCHFLQAEVATFWPG
jgi:hypothetical protein